MKSASRASVALTLIALISLIIPALANPLALPQDDDERIDAELQRQGESCQHGKNSRRCWGKYSIDTNYYEDWPKTGKTREYWLSVVEGPCSPDGVARYCQTFNGTFPGPLIWANWGDDIIVHVVNNMQTNGTSIHWHGLHMRDAVIYDGVPGVTQCPIPPGKSLTYKFKATQYGTTWYHSHFSLQYADGLLGPIVIYGPSTANYDVDLGPIAIQEWYHDTAWRSWINGISQGGEIITPSNGLVNGINVFDCALAKPGQECTGNGRRLTLNFTKGTKYLIRIINTSNNAHSLFSIDGHKLKVVAADLVPIKPYVTERIEIAVGQRYDVIVEANAPPGDYWLRAGLGCTRNDDLYKMAQGIIRYDPASTAEPTGAFPPLQGNPDLQFCGDEPAAKLVPHLKLDVTNAPTIVKEENMFAFNASRPWFQWTFNNSSLVLDPRDPTMEKILDGNSAFPSLYNVIKAEKKSHNRNEWFILVIEDDEPVFLLYHPIHLHGHDFWVLSQKDTPWDGTTNGFNFRNPPRRDTATLTKGGHLAIAFQLDNPGAWLVHCHIAWHASQGMALQIVESQSKIKVDRKDQSIFRQTCADWDAAPAFLHKEMDSGI